MRLALHQIEYPQRVAEHLRQVLLDIHVVIGHGHQKVDIIRVFDQTVFGQLQSFGGVQRRQIDDRRLLGQRQELAARIKLLQGQRQLGALRRVRLRGGHIRQGIFRIRQILASEIHLLVPIGNLLGIGGLRGLERARRQIPVQLGVFRDQLGIVLRLRRLKSIMGRVEIVGIHRQQALGRRNHAVPLALVHVNIEQLLVHPGHGSRLGIFG